MNVSAIIPKAISGFRLQWVFRPLRSPRVNSLNEFSAKGDVLARMKFSFDHEIQLIGQWICS
jgi:hypothetical protein